MWNCKDDISEVGILASSEEAHRNALLLTA